MRFGTTISHSLQETFDMAKSLGESLTDEVNGFDRGRTVRTAREVRRQRVNLSGQASEPVSGDRMGGAFREEVIPVRVRREVRTIEEVVDA